MAWALPTGDALVTAGEFSWARLPEWRGPPALRAHGNTISSTSPPPPAHQLTSRDSTPCGPLLTQGVPWPTRAGSFRPERRMP
jgi:hypothetical protein